MCVCVCVCVKRREWKMVEGCQVHYFFLFVLIFKKVGKIVPF